MLITGIKNSPKRELHRTLKSFDVGRDIRTIHASEVTRDDNFCPREFIIMELVKKKKGGSHLPTPMKYTFALGSMMEALVRDDWLKERVVGNWKCIRCDHEIKWDHGRRLCPNCHKAGVLVYEEFSLVSGYSGISGKIDMFFDAGLKKLSVVELKSIDKDFWKKLYAPMAEHKYRTNLYLRVVDESNFPHKKDVNLKEAVLLYMGKMYGLKDPSLRENGIPEDISPFKEFRIRRDDDQTQSVTRRSRLIKLFWEGKSSMIPGRVCSTNDCRRARKCTVREQCFGKMFTPTMGLP